MNPESAPAPKPILKPELTQYWHDTLYPIYQVEQKCERHAELCQNNPDQATALRVEYLSKLYEAAETHVGLQHETYVGILILDAQLALAEDNASQAVQSLLLAHGFTQHKPLHDLLHVQIEQMRNTNDFDDLRGWALWHGVVSDDCESSIFD